MLSRKWLIVLSLVTVFSMVLAACGTPETTVVEKTVEVEVPGETIVETVEVEVPGETVVETVVVEVTPTPQPTTRTGGWLDSITMVQIAPDAVVTQLQANEIDIYASALGRATDFKSAQDAGLTTSQNVGGSYELTFNPVGPVFETTGELNPFAVPAIREAMNMLIDRNYIVQEIYGGLAIPRTLAIVGAFPDYATFVSKARELEAKYAYNLEKADELITAEMEKLGATKDAGGKYSFNGNPVKIYFLIRSDGDGTRKPIGDYVSNQLETIGFAVDRQYKTSPEASPIWIGGDPADGLWHIYTGGWITTAISRDQGNNFLFYYSPKSAYGFTALWQAYTPRPEFDDCLQKLDRNIFNTLDERATLFTTCLDEALLDSVRVWLVDQKAFSPYNTNVAVTNDLAGGIQASSLFPFTLRFIDENGVAQEGGDMTWAMSAVLNDPWNPIAGSNWVYDSSPQRALLSAGTVADPFTGLAWPLRIESAMITAQEGLPIGKTLDWVGFEFVPSIEVPADAWVDWDATNQVFITAAEKFTETQTAKRKSVVTYPADMFETVKWHDGSPLSAADFVMGMIMRFDPAKPESAIYDESRVGDLDSFLSTFKGMKVTSTSPLTIEFYSDSYALDAELNVADWWPNYGYGEAPWHSIAAGNLAEENGELAYSADKADKAEVEWTSFIDGPSMAILENYLTQAATPAEEGGPVYLPYAPTMSQFVTQEEAVARYANLAKWYNLNNHFWVGTGPYYLDKVSSVEKILTLRYNEMYPDLATRWLTFSEPKIAVAEVSGPTEVVIGEEAKFDVTVTFKDEPYPAAEITSVKFLVFDATGVLVADGLAELVSDGSYTVTLTAEQSAALTAGATKLEVAVVPLLVSLPTFATYEFITVAP